MPTSSAPLPPGLPPADTLLPALLDLLPTGVVYYTPIADAHGTVVDFAFAYLNPTAQRMLAMPAQPTATYLQQFPGSVASGAFAFHRDTFLAGTPGQLDQYYRADGYDICIRALARRLDAGLLVSFSDASGQPHTAVEAALRASQAREQAAHTEAEAQRQRLHDILWQLPTCVATNSGPDHVYELVNPHYQQLFSTRLLQGLPIREALPELDGQNVLEKLDHVYRTGETHYDLEQETWLDFTNTGQLEKSYFSVFFQALRDEQGHINGVLNFAYNVTEQVIARQQVQELNQDLAAYNEELRVSNEELVTANTTLAESRHALQTLNQELEARVAQRTHALRVAQAATEAQRAQFENLFMQAPASICILSGPNLVFELVNPGYQQLFPGRVLLGKSLLNALPELVGGPVWDTLQRVYRTGQPHIDQSVRIPLARTPGAALEDAYFNHVFQARHDEQGRITGVLIFAFELTEQVRARQQVQTLNDELATTNQQLLHANVDLDTFVYTASHDLKAPISNIEGLLLALGRQLPTPVRQDPAVTQLLDMMHDSVGRFQRTIGQLTDVSKLQQAHAEPAEAVDLAAQAEAVRLDLAPALAAAGGQLTIDVGACATLRFSPKNLRSILYNLLSNAIKYQAPGRPPLVQLRCYRTAGQVALAVQDNGLGLSEEQQAKLFVMFRRLHTHVEGTGVGLFMVKRMVENAGGTIRVQSQPGEGSTFTVVLPE